ncbi:DoxX family protein [Streptomyces sp. Q6]|uniref:DoxX family protein n=1 Tax=Streptomyces citrinus TaxID=3118173 RepID=A0ACD5AKG6_9ACTN
MSLNVTLWICTGLLALVALGGGVSKAFVPTEKLAAAHGGGWTGDVPGLFVKGLGVVELFAAVGLVLPALVGVGTVMVPVTAACWVVLMVGAMATHGRRGEIGLVGVNLIYLVLAALIVWGRLGPESFGG